MSQIAFEYTDAASRPADEDEDTPQRMDNRLSATTTERVIARLKAERDDARRQLADAEADRQASAAAELEAQELVKQLRAKVPDARVQHLDDQQRMSKLQANLDEAFRGIRALQASLPRRAKPWIDCEPEGWIDPSDQMLEAAGEAATPTDSPIVAAIAAELNVAMSRHAQPIRL